MQIHKSLEISSVEFLLVVSSISVSFTTLKVGKSMDIFELSDEVDVVILVSSFAGEIYKIVLCELSLEFFLFLSTYSESILNHKTKYSSKNIGNGRQLRS